MSRTILLQLFFVLILLTACSTKPTERIIAPFIFTDQHGQQFGTDNLVGKVWVANFVFTKCTTVCPPMTAEMAGLQTLFKEEGLEVELVSFSVDPIVDSPSVLTDYLSAYTTDDSNWHMLTGYPQLEIETFAREQFQTMVQKPTSSSQVIHGTTFYLLDKNGALINEYSYIDNSFAKEMMKDIKKLK
ncbi:SCO family protein [Sporosarcina sp. CAU 1771]